MPEQPIKQALTTERLRELLEDARNEVLDSEDRTDLSAALAELIELRGEWLNGFVICKDERYLMPSNHYDSIHHADILSSQAEAERISTECELGSVVPVRYLPARERVVVLVEPTPDPKPASS